MADGRRSLKDIETEGEVNAPTNIFDQLFRDYVKTLNVSTKPDDLKGVEWHVFTVFLSVDMVY